MTREQKRIKIAEDQGFRYENGSRSPTCPKWGAPVPEYFDSLDACQQFERSIPYEDEPYYLRALKRVIQKTNEFGCASEFAQTCATADQRAEAYGIFRKLWKEGE